MPDDRDRISRFGDAARTDISMGARMLRFVQALQTRICRELEAADGVGRFAPSPVDAGAEGTVMLLVGGARFVSARVEAAARRSGEGLATGLTVDLRPAGAGAPAFGTRLHHVAVGADPVRPDDHWFDGEVWIDPAGAGTDRFTALWRAVCARHPSVADFERCRAAFDAGRPAYHSPAAVGIRFDRLRDPDGTNEEAFLFVRDAGRAVPGTAVG